MAEAAPLKRIAFVQGYAATATGLAESAYKTARGFVPGFVEPYVRQAEETALNVGAPYLTLAQDGAEKVLRSVDAQVDASLNTLAGALNYSRDLHDKNMITFNGAKEQYFGLVESAVAQAKALLDPSPYVQRVEGTVKWASDKVAFYVDPDKIVDTGVEYAGKVAAFGPVPKVVEIADPLISAGVKTYGTVHDTVVVSPLYKKLVELLLSTGTSLTATWPAKKLVEVSASPVVAPLADPLISNFTNSKYLKQLTTHLKPL